MTMEGYAPQKLEEESDSYLASLSDLMVGMLFVFIIMLMAFALNYRSSEEGHKQAEAQAQEKLAEAQTAEEVARREKERAEIAEQSAQLEKERAQERLESLESVASELGRQEELRRQMLEEMRQALELRGVTVELDQDQGILRLQTSSYSRSIRLRYGIRPR